MGFPGAWYLAQRNTQKYEGFDQPGSIITMNATSTPYLLHVLSANGLSGCGLCLAQAGEPPVLALCREQRGYHRSPCYCCDGGEVV